MFDIPRVASFVGSGLALLALHATAATVTFQQTTGYSTGAVTIRNDTPTTNINGNAQVIVGNTSTIILRGLFEFDLSQIETLAGGNPYTIDSVSFTVTTSSAGGTGNATNQYNLSVLGTNSDFDETTVTWNNAPSAAGGTIGTSLSSLTYNSGTANATRTFASSANFITAASNALAGSDNTLRLIMTAQDEGGGYLTRLNTNENATESLRPSLTINYTVIPEPATGMLVAGFGALLVFRRRK